MDVYESRLLSATHTQPPAQLNLEKKLTDGAFPARNGVGDGLGTGGTGALCNGSAGVADLDISHALSKKKYLPNSNNKYHPVRIYSTWKRNTIRCRVQIESPNISLAQAKEVPRSSKRETPYATYIRLAMSLERLSPKNATHSLTQTRAQTQVKRDCWTQSVLGVSTSTQAHLPATVDSKSDDALPNRA